MSTALPVAVIGCGHLGTFHARLYRELPGVELRAVMDTVPEKARALGESLGVPGMTDLAAALRGVRAVSVATPTVTHEAVTAACLRAGCAVLVEKPIAATAEEGERMVRAAEERGLPLAVGHVERFNPAFRAAAERVGRPRFIEAHRLATFVPRSLDVDVVLDLMIHDLDLTLALVPSAVESVDAVGVPVLTAEEDIANARLRFADGTVANLTASRVSRERVRKIRFFGERRYVSLDLMERRAEEVVLEEAGGGAGLAAGAASGSSAAVGAGAGTGAAADATKHAATGATGDAAAHAAGSAPGGPHTAADPALLALLRAASADAASASADPADDTGGGGSAEELLAFFHARRLRLRHDLRPFTDANPLRDELADFVGAVRGGTLHGASGADGLRALRLALEVRDRVRASLARMGLPRA